MGKRKSKISELSEYILALCVMVFFNALPFKTSLFLGKTMGRLWYFLDGTHRKRAEKNLKIAFSKKPISEIKKLALQSFEHMGMTCAEILLLLGKRRDLILNSVGFENFERFGDAVRKNRGVILVTAHIGNWELLLLVLSLKGFKMNAIARTLDNHLLDRKINSLRTSFGSRVIPRQTSIRSALKCLKNKEIVGMLIDQNTGKDEGVFVDFFGVPACTTPAAARWALKMNAAVIPVFCIREKPGAFKIITGEEFYFSSSGNKTDDVVKNTALLTGVIEQMIRKYPQQWLWVHRRWKTRPPVYTSTAKGKKNEFAKDNA